MISFKIEEDSVKNQNNDTGCGVRRRGGVEGAGGGGQNVNNGTTTANFVHTGNTDFVVSGG
jgi:hypothetical protein